MRDESVVAFARGQASVEDTPAGTVEETSVKEAALAKTDYSAKSQGDLFAVKPGFPAQEQAVIRRALEILESRLRTDPGPYIETPAEAVEYFKLTLAAEPAEVFAVAFLDSRHRLIEIREMFRGTVDGASVYPREIVRAVIETNAAAVVMAHQHPSGNPEPSEADRSITLKLGKALASIDVRVLDHVVIGGMEHVSLAERGWI